MALPLKRVILALQVALFALIYNASSAIADASACTDYCWDGAATRVHCANPDKIIENTCMCSSAANWDVFFYCNLLCYDNLFDTGLNDYQICGPDKRDLTVPGAGPFTEPPSYPFATTETLAPSAPVPNTFKIVAKQLISGTYYPEFPATIGFCGVPGTSCNEKKIQLDSGESKREADPQIIGEIPWRTDYPSAMTPKATKARSTDYFTTPTETASIGYCGVAGSACNKVAEGDLVEPVTMTIRGTMIGTIPALTYTAPAQSSALADVCNKGLCA